MPKNHQRVRYCKFTHPLQDHRPNDKQNLWLGKWEIIQDELDPIDIPCNYARHHFNQADILANSLSSCIAATQGCLTQRKSEFYMGSYLIDCILCIHQFMKLNCTWNQTKTPFYVAYQILWAHKYSSFYKLIDKEFLMLLYELIFLEECNCMA